eukprot:3349530-Pleurochrysis_carterae.AAC.1
MMKLICSVTAGVAVARAFALFSRRQGNQTTLNPALLSKHRVNVSNYREFVRTLKLCTSYQERSKFQLVAVKAIVIVLRTMHELKSPEAAPVKMSDIISAALLTLKTTGNSQ